MRHIERVMVGNEVILRGDLTVDEMIGYLDRVRKAIRKPVSTAEPWPLQRLDTPDEKARAAGVAPKTILKPDRDNGIVILDSETQLSGVPAEAWSYRLGNRSGLDWVLDQHKEKTPKDPTIRERFNTYRFADYKEKVVDLLMRVTRVSVETVAITQAMRALKRDG